MEIVRSARPVRELLDVKLWHCGGCRVVHMAVKDVVLNFTREEFANLTEAVVDLNYSGWETTGDASIVDLIEHESEKFADAVVH
ncbi:MAG: hypothetical protein ABI878_14785 [Acidobacteriota bacterium]